MPVLLSTTGCAALVVFTIWALKVRLLGEGLATGAARVPVPIRARACGLFAALSVNESVPEASPAAVGVKVIATVHVPAAATGAEVEQVVPEAAMAKGPVTPIALKVRLMLPVLVTVTVCGALVAPTGSDGNVGDAGKPTVAPVPVPLKLTLWVLPPTPPASSVMVREPVRVPAALGSKVTLMVQFPEAATLEPQVLVWEKSLKPAVTATLAMERVAVPGFVRVTT